MSKSVGAGRKCQDGATSRSFGTDSEKGPGKGARWLGGQWDGRVNINHKLASRTADTGRGEIRKVVGVISTIA